MPPEATPLPAAIKIPPLPLEMKQHRPPACELCAAQAVLFCEPDAAFLCWSCDASVHGANFLVARHFRLLACSACHSLDAGRRVSGPRPRRVQPLCPSCHPDPPSGSPTSSSSSSCLSTSESAAAPRADKPVPAAAPRRTAARRQRRGEAEERVEAILLSWTRRMGLRSGRRCAEAAARACLQGATAALPLRVALAAALWSAIKLCENEATAPRGGGAALMRLEACSGVPARIIVAAESRIARVAEEGSAECS